MFLHSSTFLLILMLITFYFPLKFLVKNKITLIKIQKYVKIFRNNFASYVHSFLKQLKSFYELVPPICPRCCKYIIGFSHYLYVLLMLNKAFSLLKTKCLSFIVHLQRHTKEFLYIMAYEKNCLQCLLKNLLYFEYNEIYPNYYGALQESVEFRVRNVYSSFTGSHDKIPLHYGLCGNIACVVL